MCTSFKADFDHFGSSFKPYFKNPVTSENFCVLGFVYMSKLVRNILEDRKHLKTANDDISWEYIVQ
jgi:hypothetical protein